MIKDQSPAVIGMNKEEAPLRDGLAFYLLLGLLYIYFADSAYRIYYLFEWLGSFALTQSGRLYALAASMIMAWVLYAGGIVAACRFYRLSASELGWLIPQGLMRGHVLSGAFLGLLTYLLNTWLVTGVLFFLQNGSARALFSSRWAFSGFSGLSDAFYLFSTLNIILLAPVMEELAFRGVMFTMLSRRLGAHTGLIIASALFSLTHLTINKVFLSGNETSWAVNQFAYHFIGGVVYNLLYIRTRSLAAPISAHITYNFVASFLPRAIA